MSTSKLRSSTGRATALAFTRSDILVQFDGDIHLDSLLRKGKCLFLADRAPEGFQKIEPVTLKEALVWYSERANICHSWSGSASELCAMAAAAI